MRAHRHLQAPTEDAYRRMAAEARYRPAAPSDGFGNITAPLEDLDLDAEAQRYAERFLVEEDEQVFQIGCPDYRDRHALVFLIEAARSLCAVNIPLARKLTEMAVAELEARGDG